MHVVVYADDDEFVRATIAMGLALEGWRVHPCSDGAEAITLCEKFHPDAVLLDLEMPNVDGFEAALRIRNGAACDPARLVAITGRATEQAFQKARRSGFDAFLQKPTSFAKLVEALTPPPRR